MAGRECAVAEAIYKKGCGMNAKKEITCLRCGGTWTARIENPKRCSLCKSGYWAKPIVRHGVSAASKLRNTKNKPADTIEQIDEALIKSVEETIYGSTRRLRR